MRLLHGAFRRASDPLLYHAGQCCRWRGDHTLEGLGTAERPHPIQKAFIEEQAAQCGFCLSGVILTAKSFLDQNPKATDAELRQAMSTVLCRCFTHVRMLRAIARYQAGGVA